MEIIIIALKNIFRNNYIFWLIPDFWETKRVLLCFSPCPPKGARVIYYHSENIIVTTSITIPIILLRKSFVSSTVKKDIIIL